MRKKLVLGVCLVLCACSVKAFSQQTASSSIPPPVSGHAAFVLSLGAFVPNEGDLDPGVILGMGFEYSKDKDTLFGDFQYSPTDINVDANASNANNYILQFGYMTNFGKWERAKVGAGFQVHWMDFGDEKLTQKTFLAITEFDLTNSLSLRIQDSFSQKKSGVRFGGTSVQAVYGF